MKHKSFVLLGALILLSLISIVSGYGYRGIQLQDEDKIGWDKAGWNAVNQVKTNPEIIWVVGDSGRVRRYHVTYTPDAQIPQLHQDQQYWRTLSYEGKNVTLMDVCFPTATQGIIVGYVDDDLVQSGEKWRGVIWRTTDGGSTWSPINRLADMPAEFANDNARIPCLSVDFCDAQHGYVGCGCGYVLMTIDGGISWRLTPKRPWEGVGDKIGAIPRGYYATSYFNGYGDWYWDIAVDPSNSDHVYAVSDNNGVFYETTDGGEGLWTPRCFGQEHSSTSEQYGQYIPTVDYEWNLDREVMKDTAVEILSVDADESGNVTLGSMHGRLYLKQPLTNWWVGYPVLLFGYGSWPDEGETYSQPYGIWHKGSAMRTAPAPFNTLIWQTVGSYGFLSTDMSWMIENNIRLFPYPFIEWFSHKYAFNDVAWNFRTPMQQQNPVYSIWSLAAGEHGALLWFYNGFGNLNNANNAPPYPPSVNLTIKDKNPDNGGSVRLEAACTNQNVVKFEWVTYMMPDQDNWHIPDPNTGLLFAVETQLGITDKIGTNGYYPDQYSYTPKITLPGYAQPFKVRGLDAGRNPVPGMWDAKTNNESGVDNSYPLGSLVTDQGGRFITNWPGLHPDSMIVELWWKDVPFISDSSVAGYFVCPVEVTCSYNPQEQEITYYYWGNIAAGGTGGSPFYSVTRQLPPDSLVYDSMKLMIIWPPPPPPSADHRSIVHTAPVLRNTWHGIGRKPLNPQNYVGAYYSIMPVDYTGNVGDQRYNISMSGFTGWSPWFFVRYPGSLAIEEQNGSVDIPFALEVTMSKLNSLTATIKYSLPADAFVNLNLYDVTGRRVKTFVNGKLQAGFYTREVTLSDESGNQLADGIYIIKYSAEGCNLSRKISILK